jgi:hypothetical protein
MTEDLFNAKDITRVRELLSKEQKYKCAITGINTPNSQMALDHRHDAEQLVRGAVNKHANMLLGKLENLQVRYLNHWYEGSLSDFLRCCADYLDKPKDRRWRHPHWTKKIMTEFNKLKVSHQQILLEQLGQPEGSNIARRRELLQKALLTRKYNYDTIHTILKTIKDTK